MMQGTGKRLVLVGSLALVMVLLCLAMWHFGPQAFFWPKCLLYKWTGLHCPGCGLTRGVNACLHGDLLLGWRYNLLLMPLLPLLALGLAGELIGWVRGRPLPWRLRVTSRMACWLFGLMMLFGVLRNIPYRPFDLLAPPAGEARTPDK
ncbi:MAG TPA: DUF2752 domain-containing protein [Luteolibacter sp.]|nr:DUF2752 domain-containing protein [Luteolibacter sp.]